TCVALPNFLTKEAPYKGPGADSEEKREPVSDIDIAVADSLKVLDLKRPIREATELRTLLEVRFVPIAEVALIRSPRRQGRGTLAGTVTRAALLAAILLHIARRPQHVDKGQARL